MGLTELLSAQFIMEGTYFNHGFFNLVRSGHGPICPDFTRTEALISNKYSNAPNV